MAQIREKKRWLQTGIGVAVMLLWLGFAQRVSAYEPEEVYFFEIVNCQEWVSLRSQPDVNSYRIMTVPLGSIVQDCHEYVNGFCYVDYGGTYGYILADYLSYYESSVPPEAIYWNADGSRVGYATDSDGDWNDNNYNYDYNYDYDYDYDYNYDWEDYDGDSYDYGDWEDYGSYLQTEQFFQLMTREELCSEGYEQFQYTEDGYEVYAYHAYDEGETLRVGCLKDDEPIWGYILTTSCSTELQTLTAFLAGTEEEPAVVLFNSEETMQLLELKTGGLLWEKKEEELEVGGSLTFAVSEDGTIYCTGYYDANVTALTPEGEILWKNMPEEPEIYWPYQMEEDEDTITVIYAMGTEEGNYMVTYDKETGEQLDTTVGFPE